MSISNPVYKTVALVVAGGRGARAGDAHDTPKQYRALAAKPLLARTLEAFLNMERVDAVLPVIGGDHHEMFSAMGLSHPKLLEPVSGGTTRQLSCLAGLEALEPYAPDFVLIHDGARPIVEESVVGAVLDALETADGAIPATLVTDTIKRSLDGKTIGGTEDRTQLFAAQTPQGFRFSRILGAHRKAVTMTDGFTDDAAVAEWANLKIVLAQGSTRNIKVTLAEDFPRAERILAGDRTMETRIGTGYDVHAFAEGKEVILGNVAIPHDAALKGHSDADVVLHALSDALYGALAEGDIGHHFPPSDPQWKGADSRLFLAHAAERVRARGGRIVNLDCTVICEAPRINPHVMAMRERIAEIAGIAVSRVAVKATTSEQLGFTGRREGIAAQAMASIELPGDDT
ncbi:bifunctional 2-C-methyl-D-erythritol 4-phosphate cytidylyltransferase/2-C-methyl-D-erythritol 2,4-cyclodiphosphate synthase [Pelagibacterium montanilacus]|uniref:bifunctional 2-C-methyl-D-erythritol 4-phosphate cytidylyltransferase/2-C-methyl-D-erythritol 2,4-cyclodiphosphate synthase n=1 Tax=Pelagibacterium montanilacus TaxID=2185280 RepID=UPI000F8E755A|nr:bifunctional 2-C-methyl-D-erythritol 4-phosphate cytidylyltransferase/2-C-methyl-D-erythritol 2,4-cyclodiphosphate synthase [Pelagibacterium montanilacus]